MQRLEVSGAVRPLYESLGVKGLTAWRRLVDRVDLVLSAKSSIQFTIHLSASHLHRFPKDHTPYVSQDNSVHSQRARRYNFISMNM